ncbi:hypothetical protein QOZ80_1BG0085040 [Eleusine coracana subsp. coracana]|nr:hypothetical protein QOZ80_1BG0085040 [Eleusine coracana subsp. coracana]
MAAGHLEDDETGSADCLGITLTFAFMPGFFLIFICVPLYFNPGDTEFWVKVSGVEGLDRSAVTVTAPTFNITLHVKNQGGYTSPQFCGKGGSVDVAYENVPLAHGELPEFCVPTGVVGLVPVVATSEGLGLPDDLYDRMESQRQRGERVTLAVHVKLREVPGSQGLPVLLWCTAVLHGQPEGPFVCPVIVEGMVHTIYIPVL